MFTFSNFQFLTNCKKKTMALEKSVFYTAAYGLYPTCVDSIDFTIHARHAHGLFAMKCITLCSDMNINISNTDSFTQMIYLWYKYYSKWICVSFSFQYISWKALTLSILPFTRDTHMVCLQWNVSHCVQIWILTFQTQIHLHKWYIFDTNIIQSEYAFLFPFSI